MNSAVIIRKYDDSDRESLKNIFFSNVPLYFHADEWQDFNVFLQEDLQEECVYEVLVLDEKIIGAGGFAMEDDGVVSLCWGMLDASQHKTGLGRLLLEHRLELISKLFPGSAVKVDTTQHVYGFFEKYGFTTRQIDADFWAPGLHVYRMTLP